MKKFILLRIFLYLILFFMKINPFLLTSFYITFKEQYNTIQPPIVGAFFCLMLHLNYLS